MQKILALTADAGFGHRKAADAIAAALQETYNDRCQVEIVNPLDDRFVPALLRKGQSGYDQVIDKVPELYRLGYEASDAAAPTALAERAVMVALFQVMREFVKSYRPDAIIITYPFFAPSLEAVFAIRGLENSISLAG